MMLSIISLHALGCRAFAIPLSPPTLAFTVRAFIDGHRCRISRTVCRQCNFNVHLAVSLKVTDRPCEFLMQIHTQSSVHLSSAAKTQPAASLLQDPEILKVPVLIFAASWDVRNKRHITHFKDSFVLQVAVRSESDDAWVDEAGFCPGLSTGNPRT